MAERALVTGGAGFIGRFLCRRLLADGFEVYVVDNLSRHGLDPEVRELGRHVRMLDHDLAGGVPDSVPGDCALVAHLAAWVGVGRIETEPYRALKDNVAITTSLLDWCAAHAVGTVFLSSTSEIADGAAALGLAGLPIAEDVPFVLPSPRAPRASYALSKLVAESLLLHAASAIGIRVRIGRYFNVYGPRMGTVHVIPQFIGRVLARASPFPLYGGENTRAFCYISDAIEATMLLAALPADEPVIANIGNDGEEIAMTELARRLFAVAGYSAPLNVRPAPPGSPLRRLPDLGTLRKLTGYQPAVPLDEGLALTYEWYARRAGRP